jgi:hypothetical protein
MRPPRAACWFVPLALLAAAPAATAQPTSSDIAVSLVYEAREAAAAVPAPKDGCVVHLAPALDQRQNKQTLGHGAAGPIVAGDAAAVRRAVGDGPAPDGLLVRPALVRLYFWPAQGKLISMLAVRVAFTDRNGVAQEKTYRAYGDAATRSSAPRELVAALNLDLDHVRQAMAADLVALCRGTKIEPLAFVRSLPASQRAAPR